MDLVQAKVLPSAREIKKKARPMAEPEEGVREAQGEVLSHRE